MALDGIVIASLVKELQDKLIEGRLFKISQPESDELIITFKNNKEQFKLLISASASLPLTYFTETSKANPMTAPNFCMLLRKHINSGKIKRIYQPGLERIINIEIEHYNELGDLCLKTLIVELMGKHSNIIFCDQDYMIIDSIKRVSASISSVREVLPGRPYFIPETMHKLNPLNVDALDFREAISSKGTNISKALYTSFTGISPIVAEEICALASIDSKEPATILSENEMTHLYRTFLLIMEDINDGRFKPAIYFENDEPIEFSAIPLTIYNNCTVVNYESTSSMLEDYYAKKNAITRIRQKSADIRRVVQTALEKDRKKYDLQSKQMKDTEKKDKFKVYGELITAYGYNLEANADKLVALNYYTNSEITIPLDPDLSPIDNAKKYFDKYNKLKRTYEALVDIIKTTEEEINHLESISTSLDIAADENTLKEIKEELIQFGYIRKRGPVKGKKEKIVSKPLHYLSKDGFHMYVGKNNFQNDRLTFEFATGNDWWFHAKGIPGSHVIVKTEGKDLPDSVFEEAGRLAGYYSKGRAQEKVEIDYTQKKNVKKTNGGKPGFVIYHTNYSLLIEPVISNIEEV